MRTENPLLDDLEGVLGYRPVEPESRSEADRIINHISALKGEIPDDVLAEFGNTSQRAQKIVNGLIERVRRQEEKYIKDVAEGLYSQNARVLYELIQNADDAKYMNSGHRNYKPPHLTFTLKPGQLVIETNELGFTLPDVLAICSAGESSKRSRTDGSAIGEKGIGFKSVFTISRLVTIESGFWGFVFKYDRSRPLSMITPSQTIHKQLVQGTQITLALDPKHERVIFDELQSLPTTALVFLRQVQLMTISLQGTSFSHNDPSERQIQKFLQPSLGKVTQPTGRSDILRLVIWHKAAPVFSRREEIRFRLFRKTHGQMPEESKRAGRKESEIQLAFPIDNIHGSPSISEEGEYVFAFLPVSKQEHLPFLIQGDFLTTMSREDLVARGGNDWNDRLFDCVVDTFLSAVQHFVHDRIFTVEWLHYLIQRPLTTFWAPLQFRLLQGLPQLKIFMDASESRWVTASQVKILPSFFRFYEEPLLRDIVEPTVYLSKQYVSCQVEHLLPLLGVKVLSWEDISRRLNADLESGNQSQVKAAELTGEWYGQFLGLVEEMMVAFASGADGGEDRTNDLSLSPDKLPEKARIFFRKQLDLLPFIPLQRGRWVSPSKTVYFSTLEEQTIPSNIGLNLLHPEVSKTSQSNALYQALGVSDCHPEIVYQGILNYHLSESKYRHDVDCQDLILHFRFLHRFSEVLPSPPYFILRAVTSKGRISTSPTMLYSPSEHKYHAQQLIKAIPNYTIESAGLETDVMLHPLYFHKPPKSLFSGKSWLQWLEASPLISRYPPLSTDPNPTQLSELLRLVLSTDSRLFLGVLKSHWLDSYQARVNEESGLRDAIRKAKVQCSNGKFKELYLTHYPNNALRKIAEDLCVVSRYPFLDLPSDLWNGQDRDEQRQDDEWSFLKKFGVSFDVTVRFYLNALECLQEETRLNSTKLLEAALNAYESLQELANPKQKKYIQEWFEKKNAILEDVETKTWKKSKDCIWSGPNFLDHCQPLQPQYGGSDLLKNLFVDLLEIPNATYEDVHKQLLIWKSPVTWTNVGLRKKWQSASLMFAEAYTDMSDLVEPEEYEDLRILMENDQLIYVNNNWLRISECIWKSEVEIAGKTEIGDIYPTLKDFFVEVLQIETADAPVLVKAWIDAVAVAQPDLVKIKGYMRQISYLIGTNDFKDKDEFDKLFRELKRKKCIPIYQALAADANNTTEQGSSGIIGSQRTQMVKPSDQYFIVDHHRYGELLSGRIPVMACTHEETGLLAPLLKYLSIWDNRLTERVSETSAAVENLQLDRELTDYFRSRSFALAWCAAKFFSRTYVFPNAAAYRRLQDMEIYTSSGLETKVELRLADDNVISIPSNHVRAQVLNVAPDNIKIIFPEDKPLREACFRTQLPREVSRLLGIVDSKAEKSLSLLLFQRRESLLQILKEEDIPPLSWVPAPDLSAEASEIPLLPIFNPPSATSLPFRPSSSLGPSGSFGGFGGGSGFGRFGGSASQSFAGFGSSRPNLGGVENLFTQPFLGDSSTTVGDDGYTQLLRHLFNAAQDVLTDAGTGISALSAFGSDRRSEASRAKIGAAGEMFVFETLRRLGLREFGYDNWRSSIRHNVNVLDEFSNLSMYSGRDQDIVYDDRVGQVEPWLRQRSYNDFPQLQHELFAPIRYIFEIKTTIHEVQERMLMSSAQYELMRRYRLADQQPHTRTVFVLIRVSNLLSRRPRSTVIVDPASEQGRALNFEPETWAVQFVGSEAGRNGQAVAGDDDDNDDDDEL